MTRKEADKVLSYVARNIISPLAFVDIPASKVWLRLSGSVFNELCVFVQSMVDNDNIED